MAYRLSRKAEADILDIYMTGAGAFGEDQAERYHAGLQQTFEFLSDFPRAAPERAELGRAFCSPAESPATKLHK